MAFFKANVIATTTSESKVSSKDLLIEANNIWEAAEKISWEAQRWEWKVTALKIELKAE